MEALLIYDCKDVHTRTQVYVYSRQTPKRQATMEAAKETQLSRSKNLLALGE